MGKMSKKQWLVLWLFFVVYWFLGATLFYVIEHPLERERRASDRSLRDQLYDMLSQKYVSGNELDDVLDKLYDYCNKNFSQIDYKTYDDENDEENPYKWSFYNAVFFSLITASTVGYGNVSPFSPQGKILVIFYSLFGIPYFGIVVTQLGVFFSNIFVKAHSKYKAKVYETKSSLILDILKYLIPGIIVFIVVPAGVIYYMEDWDLLTAVYYTYVTLTTIGYGDYVAGHRGDLSAGYAVYKAALLFWIMFGLGYLIMILGFISRAMKSKRVIRLERKLAMRFRQTQSRIWKEFLSDVSSLRRLLNESYLLKVKPVYKEKKSVLIRGEGVSQSCPDLRSLAMGAEEVFEDKPLPRRRRAYSESGGGEGIILMPRVMSEGELTRVDKAATFAQGGNPPLEQAAFLATVVDALEEASSIAEHPVQLSNKMDGGVPTSHSGGVNMFTDQEILASELGGGGGWHLGGEPLVRNRRPRAMSESVAPNYQLSPEQKTWTSADATTLRQWTLMKNMNMSNGDMIRRRTEEELSPSHSPRESTREHHPRGLRRVSEAAINFFTGGGHQRFSSKSTERTASPPSRLDDIESEIGDGGGSFYLDGLLGMERRPSLLEALGGSGNLGPNMSPILEQTSLADFIRAMSTIKKYQEVTTQDFQRGRRQSSPPWMDDSTVMLSSGGLLHPSNPSQLLPKQLSRLKDAGTTSSTKSLSFRRSSLSPIEILQRRRFSHVPNVSTSTLSSSEDTFSRRGSYIKRSSFRRSPLVPPSVVVTSPSPQPPPSRVQEEEEEDETTADPDHIVVRL